MGLCSSWKLSAWMGADEQMRAARYSAGRDRSAVWTDALQSGTRRWWRETEGRET
jgi:hypothetical protein